MKKLLIPFALVAMLGACDSKKSQEAAPTPTATPVETTAQRLTREAQEAAEATAKATQEAAERVSASAAEAVRNAEDASKKAVEMARDAGEKIKDAADIAPAASPSPIETSMPSPTLIP